MFGRGPTYLLGGGISAFKGGISFFQFFEFPVKAVILEVGDFGGGFVIILLVVVPDGFTEFVDAFPNFR
jgi:hypothetical protein